MKDQKISKIRKTRVIQSSVPSSTIKSALRVAKAIMDNYAGDPIAPLDLAIALDMSKGSSSFRMLCGASSGYGLTEGGYASEKISLTELGKSIVSPTEEGMEIRGIKKAVLVPEVLSSFLSKYDQNKLPNEKIACNVLFDLGVPRDSVEKVYNLIIENAEFAKFLKEVKNCTYVDLRLDQGIDPSNENVSIEETDDLTESTEHNPVSRLKSTEITPLYKPNTFFKESISQVYISHGKNRSLIPQIKEFLSFGGFNPIISIEKESVSKPVPDKVFDEMRSCHAAVIIIDKEKELISADGDKEVYINPNVLIELGAARALYGNNFLLLVENGVKLPSNLQGLYEIRYSGESLDIESAMKILKVFKEMKNEKRTQFSNNNLKHEDSHIVQ